MQCALQKLTKPISHTTRMRRPVAAAAALLLFVLASSIAAVDAQPLLRSPFGNPFAWPASPSAGQTCRMETGAAHDFCGLPYELSNFQGHFKCVNSVMVGRPSNIEELSRLVQAYDRVKAVGVGHSWWREQFCAGNSTRAINIVTTELQEVRSGGGIRVDEASMTVTAPAGVTQRTLLEALDAYRSRSAPEGYTLPAFSWFLDQTVGGAVSTATHGSSLVYGSLSSQARALKLLIANGTVLDLTPASTHLWNAATTSVGRLGIILEVTFSIVKNAAVRRAKADIGVSEFVADIKNLSSTYTDTAASSGANSLKVWQVVKPWDETQWFWFIPTGKLWEVTYTRQQPLTPEEVQQVVATDGPNTSLPGAFPQQRVQSAGTGVGIERNPRFWSDTYETFLAHHAAPGLLPARQSYVSITELESRIGGTFNSYDQHEAAVPLSKAGECMAAVAAELYGPRARLNGFRTPALVRLIKAETSYLSPASGEPVLYINIEDHVSYAIRRTNDDFQAIMQILRSPVCGGRLHWGKAGWPQHASCFDGAREYPRWCDFGCAVAELDPAGKFAGMSDVWRWRAVDRASGQDVEDFSSCCLATGGFDYGRCSCAGRSDC